MRFESCHLLAAILSRVINILTINFQSIVRKGCRDWIRNSGINNWPPRNKSADKQIPVMRQRTRSLISHAFLFICLCCGTSHIMFITYKYFSFETTTRITMDKKQTMDAPTLITCVKYMDVMDYKALSLKMGIPIKSGDTIDHNKFADKITIRDIFLFTPPVHQIMKRCTYRRKQDRRVLLQEGSDCNFFRMIKFVMQSYVCYTMCPRNRVRFAIDELASSYNFEHTVFVVEWDKIFLHAQTLFVMLTDAPLPYRSRLYGSIKLLDGRNNTHVTDVLVRNKITNIKLLPKPYDTACNRTYNQGDKTACLIRKMKEHKLDRIPNTEIITEPYDQRQVHTEDEEDATTRQMLDQIYAECDEEADGEKCDFTISETDARFYDSDNHTYMTFRAMSPAAPNSLIVSSPKFPFEDYLLYVSSCFGIWFGLSIHDMEPVRMWPKIRKRLQRCAKILPMSDQRLDPSDWTHVTLSAPVTGVRPMPSQKLAAVLNRRNSFVSGKQ